MWTFNAMFDKPRSHRNHRPAKWTSEYQVHKSVCPCKLHGRQWIIYTVYKQSEIHIIDYKYVHYITMSYIDIRIVYVYVYNHTITVFIPYCTKISCYTDAPWCPPQKKGQNTNFLHLTGNFSNSPNCEGSNGLKMFPLQSLPPTGLGTSWTNVSMDAVSHTLQEPCGKQRWLPGKPFGQNPWKKRYTFFWNEGI